MEVARLVEFWLHWGQMPQQQCRHMQEKTQIKIMILKISNTFFHQKRHDLNHRFIKPPRLGVESPMVFTCVFM